MSARRASVKRSGETSFRTIGQAAEELGLKPHVLRYWETRFAHLRPMKRADGRRYYRPEDMDVLRVLQNLLHVRGMTLRGAAKALEEASPFQEGSPAESEGIVATIESVSAPQQSAPGDAGLAAAARLGRSVGALQAIVREAVARGDFGPSLLSENEAAREKLETLLSDLTRLKSRMDDVRVVDDAD